MTAGRYVLRLLLGACSAAEEAACALLLEPRSSGRRRTLGALATVLAAESVYHLEAAATRQLPPVMRRFTAPATLGVKLVRVGERPPTGNFRGVHVCERSLRGACRWRVKPKHLEETSVFWETHCEMLGTCVAGPVCCTAVWSAAGVMSASALKRLAYQTVAISTSAPTSLCARLALEPTEKEAREGIRIQGEIEARTTPCLADSAKSHSHSSASSGVSQEWFDAVMCA